MSAGKDTIMARIREALSIPRKVAHAHSGPHGAHAPQAHAPTSAGPGPQAWLPAVGAGRDAWLESFRERSILLKTELVELKARADLPAAVARLAAQSGWKKVATHKDPLVAEAARNLALPNLDTSAPYDADALEACCAGITACECAVAQTGSVLVSSAKSGGRALSILVPHHVVVASLDQLVPDLPAAMAIARQRLGSKPPSMMCFVTGPSRTGDIERILVLGAHGPKRLTVFLVP